MEGFCFESIPVALQWNCETIVHFEQKTENSAQLSINKKNCTAAFYGWSSIVSRLQNHYEETVYFLPLSSQGAAVLLSSTSES